MSDDDCTCCGGTVSHTNDAETNTGRWLADSSALDAELPEDMQVALGQLLASEPVETVDEWLGEVRRRTGGGSITVEDLCHSDDETEHWGELDGERYHFQCFYDAVILSALAETPVDIRTESPEGTVIEAHAVGDEDLTVSPESAVFSLGVDKTVDPPADGEPSHADIYAAVCPYVKAFPDREAYEQWAKTVPAATVATPLLGATEMASKLVE